MSLSVVDKHVKQEMAASINDLSIHKKGMQLSFTSVELLSDVRFVDDKEFIYQGHHYDVINSHNEDGKIVINCVNDSRENELFSWFKKTLDHQDSGNNTSKTSFSIHSLDWIFETTQFSFSEQMTQTIFSEITFIPLVVYSETTTPPPNC